MKICPTCGALPCDQVNPIAAKDGGYDQTAIVARVWKALGVTDYASAKGKAIDELVAEAVEKAWRYDQCSK